jgi:hypothetical protein
VTLFWTSLAVTLFPDALDAGLAGLAMNYSMQATGAETAPLAYFPHVCPKPVCVDRSFSYSKPTMEALIKCCSCRHTAGLHLQLHGARAQDERCDSKTKKNGRPVARLFVVQMLTLPRQAQDKHASPYIDGRFGTTPQGLSASNTTPTLRSKSPTRRTRTQSLTSLRASSRWRHVAGPRAV